MMLTAKLLDVMQLPPFKLDVDTWCWNTESND